MDKFDLTNREETLMRNKRNYSRRSGFAGGLIGLVAGVVFLALSNPLAAQTISDPCAQCHNDKYQDWKASSHPRMFMKAEDAQNRGIPLPEGYSWNQISYVIGGNRVRSLYLDLDGYIITQGNGNAGDTQYNYLTGEWSDFHANQPDGTVAYDCGRCHTTNYSENGNQDGLPGIMGTFEEGGIQCVQCHGGSMHADMGSVDDSAEACGACHSSDDVPGSEPNVILASNGYVSYHQQYNELMASGAHAGALDCSSCHNPHKPVEFSIVQECEDCHSDIAASYSGTTMYNYQVECNDCHMPMAVLEGQPTGPFKGDTKSHIFRINPDPDADMFSGDGMTVNLENGEAAVTMDFACQGCHATASLEELGKFAVDFHNPNKSLAEIGINPGLTGTWWNENRGGEGFLLEITSEFGPPFMFLSFYTYDDMGNQVYLVATFGERDGTQAELKVNITGGGNWGADFNPGTVEQPEWGTGTIDFPTCTSATATFIPNDDAVAAGFTEFTYNLTRVFEASNCPSFNNESGEPLANN
jgi:nitrate/TMAO reductase-like tetraheme cytochrome c subunit